ncbi:PEP-CTERM sorting domain-containing protein [Croceicoccus estronivorus]|nr:PEP-CTERM sorting domain-containing protein [Croceicoccus estronivorus]
MKLNRKSILLSAAAASFAMISMPALADTIVLDSSSIGQSYTFDYNGFSGSTEVDGLTASTTFTLTGISGDQYFFDYSVANTTSDPVDSRISSFGFNTNPDIVGATSTGAFSYTTLNSSYPNKIGDIDVCFKDADTGACSGGGNGGLTDGQTGTGSFTLSFGDPVSSLTLGDFYVRYQSVDGAGNVTSASGYGTNTTSSSSSSSGGTEVPEPGVLGLMGVGLVAIGLLRRRRQYAKAAL